MKTINKTIRGLTLSKKYLEVLQSSLIIMYVILFFFTK